MSGNAEELKRLRELETEYAVLETKVQALEKKLDTISGHLSKVLWFFGGGLISAFVGWVATGGLMK